MATDTPERLHKALARAGIASRRQCEQLIAQGRVSVNGQIVREAGSRVRLAQDHVQVDGKPVQAAPEHVYILLHKPAGVVSTARDPQGRTTVLDLVPSETRLFPVGRLDADSEGLLLLTNDGDLAHHLTHPRFAIEKEYHVLLERRPSAETLRAWRAGVLLHGKRTAPAQVSIGAAEAGGVWLRVVLREGRKRQIREVARALGHSVRRLLRVREGSLHLGRLSAGQWRHLSSAEVRALQAHAGQPAAP
jgi:23S rRNA pseudouridine2605 synthase